jgi:polysaccharide pyruvyl transferase WcaK-like protein
MMEPARPIDEAVASSLRDGAVGINFSWLMARFVTRGSKRAWIERCTDIASAVAAETSRPLLLVPHVTLPSSDDHALLAEVQARLPASIDTTLAPASLSAAETKWLISRCSAFVGARTHSTIAALSSGIPTLSLAYSRKAVGLNRDILGSEEYCIGADQMTPQEIIGRLRKLFTNEDAIRTRLAGILPQLKIANLEAAESLRPMIEGEKTPKSCKCRVCRAHGSN